MLAWAVVDKAGNLKWWCQGGESLGRTEHQQYDVFRLKRHANEARLAWDKAEGKCAGLHRVVKVQILEAE